MPCPVPVPRRAGKCRQFGLCRTRHPHVPQRNSVPLRPPLQGKLDDDGKTIELEVKIKGKEGDSKEERELEYTVAL